MFSVGAKSLAPGTLGFSFFCSYLLLSETVPSLFFHYLSVYLPFSVSVIWVCICIFICILSIFLPTFLCSGSVKEKDVCITSALHQYFLTSIHNLHQHVFA